MLELIGMLDSAYVRRVAISMQLLGIAYRHQRLSVFSTYDQFRAINPLVKAPTLVCEDGVQLVDSTLILDYLEALAGRSLMPTALAQRRAALHLIGLALAACDKTAQIVHEKRLAPAEKQYAPWERRIRQQQLAALEALEHALQAQPLACGTDIGQDGITVAVAWRFTQLLTPALVPPAAFPLLSAHAARAEQQPAFIAAPP